MRGEGGGGALDAGQVGEVDVEEFERCRVGRVGVGGLDVADGHLGAVFGAAGEVDCCAGGVEEGGEGVAKALVCACDEVDAGGGGREVGGGEGWGWGEVLRPEGFEGFEGRHCGLGIL